MRTAWLPALGLFVLAPACAEYLWGYDDSTGHPGTLVGNLIVFSPLYGAPALLIRELARRRGLGWPGILLLAAAFGVVQAAIVDQSMWSTGYRDIPYWEDMSVPTYLAPIGLSLYLALSFVGGHVILSIGSPIALVESLTPRRRHERWLGPVVLWVVAFLYAAACALVMKDAYDTGEASATWGQLVGSSVGAVGLVVAAHVVGRRPAMIVPGTVPRPLLVGAAAYAAMVGWVAIPPTRIGTALVALLALGTVVVVWRWSHRGDWRQSHVVALAGGAVVAAGCFAFLTTPIGEVSDAEKYGHNVTLLALMVALSLGAALRARPGYGRSRA
ncbi:hypothetical protein ASC77_23255 [Nocardioides sp. Root1257]|uniref:hypothetical protein n=1 Tax=unclassified Nocardioides TaxID=2615069 RepID=UPI000700D78D|nr:MULTISPECIES: hypothetical protein [unclassified Nocardioides]KQW42592.1 hypothetical protein ASC77_23255 [Nocardioides sp. Root1257]KRC39850.1 hypothetical protein ASE24_23050 [Nocardioides sp. Root224]